MKFFISLLMLMLSVSLYASNRQETVIDVYFEGTDYELHVYTIKGRFDGNTVMIMGGIQGDEPGGYLSADLYTELKLEKGNLIVIPRANFKSVILFDRGPEGDMNRLFVDDLNGNNLDYQVVKVIMDYMSKADIFLNLHDGWGFYSPVYVDKNRNPRRFGQSIIVDEDRYNCSDGRILDLEAMAYSVLEAVNAKIPDINHHLAYFNTNTGNPDGMYKDMQKTATWYALKNYCVPSFGIEASKNLKYLEDKVLYHNYAVNEFMKLMDVVPELPSLFLAPATMDEAVVLVDGVAISVKDGDTVRVNSGSEFQIIRIMSNHSRGVSCDVLGHGNYNDLGKVFYIRHDTKVAFRKDNKEFASFSIEVIEHDLKPEIVPMTQNYIFEIIVDGEPTEVKNGDTFKISKGSNIVLVGLKSGSRKINLPINLRGWVPISVQSNTGDDRNYTIVAGEDFIKSYSINGLGVTYPITVDNINGKEIARIYMELI